MVMAHLVVVAWVAWVVAWLPSPAEVTVVADLVVVVAGVMPLGHLVVTVHLAQEAV